MTACNKSTSQLLPPNSKISTMTPRNNRLKPIKTKICKATTMLPETKMISNHLMVPTSSLPRKAAAPVNFVQVLMDVMPEVMKMAVAISVVTVTKIRSKATLRQMTKTMIVMMVEEMEVRMTDKAPKMIIVASIRIRIRISSTVADNLTKEASLERESSIVMILVGLGVLVLVALTVRVGTMMTITKTTTTVTTATMVENGPIVVMQTLILSNKSG